MKKCGGTHNKVSASITDGREVTLHFGAGGTDGVSLVKFAMTVELDYIVFIMDSYRVA